MKNLIFSLLGCTVLLSARSQECEYIIQSAWALQKESKSEIATAFLSYKIAQDIDPTDMVHYLNARALIGKDYVNDMDTLRSLCLIDARADKEMWEWYEFSFRYSDVRRRDVKSEI